MESIQLFCSSVFRLTYHVMKKVRDRRVLRYMIPKIIDQSQKLIKLCESDWFNKVYCTLYPLLAHVNTRGVKFIAHKWDSVKTQI